jgi:hypothetical protein
VVARFAALLDSGHDPHLLFCGDLVHGPAIAQPDWPDHFGDFYRDETAQLLVEARRLQAARPGRVHFLLGNRGGPRRRVPDRVRDAAAARDGRRAVCVQ